MLFVDAIDWSGDLRLFRDADHLNRRGANAFAAFLHERLAGLAER